MLFSYWFTLQRRNLEVFDFKQNNDAPRQMKDGSERGESRRQDLAITGANPTAVIVLACAS
jgi:hypothetical protein